MCVIFQPNEAQKKVYAIPQLQIKPTISCKLVRETWLETRIMEHRFLAQFSKSLSIVITHSAMQTTEDVSSILYSTATYHHQTATSVNLMFIGPCIIVIVEEWKTNLMSLAILFHSLCAQHVSNINISIIRSLRLCCWITTSVVLFSVRCVLGLWCGWF